jgi:hypothetical protein
MATQLPYDAFMSYSHSTDAELAPVLQRLICRVGRPWFRRDVLRVFRDSTSLVTTDDMWHALVQAMAGSRYFVLMASPVAAQSHWVQREITWWLENRGPSSLLIVLTEGVIRWDPTAGDFDWTVSSALPRSVLEHVFPHEPLWEDVSGARGLARRGQPNLRLRDAARTIAAALYGKSKEQVDGEDEREARQALLFRRGAVSGLAVLFMAAVVLAIVASAQRASALEQLRLASAQAIAAESQNLGIRDPAQSARLAALAYRTDGAAQTTAALMSAIERNRHVTAFLESEVDSSGRYRDGRESISRTRHSPDGRLVAGVSSQSGQVRVWDVASHAVVATLTPPHEGDGNAPPTLTFLENGQLAVLFGQVADVWDIPAQSLVTSTTVNGGTIEAISPDGGVLAVLASDGSGGYTVDARAAGAGTLVASGLDAAARVTELVTGRPTPRSLFPDQPRDFMASTADGRTAAILIDYSRIETWDLVGKRMLTSRQLPGEPGWLGVALSGDGRTVLAGNDKGEVLAMPGDLSTSTPLGQMPASVKGIAAGPDGSVGSVVDDLGNVHLLSPLTDHRFREIPIASEGADPDEAPYLVSSDNGLWLGAVRSTGVTVVDVTGGRTIGTYPFDRAWAGEQIYFSPDGARFSIVEPGRVVTRTLPSGELVESVQTSDPLAAARALQRQMNDVLLVTLRAGDSGRLLALWAGGEQILAEYAPGRAEQAVSALRSGYIAVVRETRDDADGLTSYALHRNAAPTILGRTDRPGDDYDTAVDATGRILAFDSSLLDLASGAQTPLSGGNGYSSGTSSTFVNHGALLARTAQPTRWATGSIRTRLMLWHTAQGRLIGEWIEPASFAGLGPADAPLARIDDDRVATFRPNGSVAVWDVGPELWLRRLCDLAGPLDEVSRQSQLGVLTDDVGDPCAR